MAFDTIYRIDGRSGVEIGRSGFRCRNVDWLCDDRAFARILIESLVTRSAAAGSDRLPAYAREIMAMPGGGKVATLSDLMASVKKTLKGTDAFWVSTDPTPAGGGRTEANTFEIVSAAPLSFYDAKTIGGRIALTELTKASHARCVLVLDRPNLDDAGVIGIAQGGSDTVEVAFLTRLTADRGFTITKL